MNELAVYVHIPFCTVKCGYCDFNAYAGLGALMEPYAGALLAEIDAWARFLGPATVTSISFGGGTPGEFPAASIAAVLGVIRERWTVAPGAEVSLEANPGTSNGHYFRELRSAGVTRLSLGAQSFDAAELRFLDRIHSPEATAAALRLAREAAFESISLDLIYGLPGQRLLSWRDSVEAALSLRPDHLSCYALTVEEGTPLARRVTLGEVASPDPDDAADMYEWTERRVGGAGFHHYELSNWALAGHESRHNLAYWTDVPYLGIGAGAHGYLEHPAGDGRVRYENVAHPAAYIASMRDVGQGNRAFGVPAVASWGAVDRQTAMFDWLETHLRLVDGFDPALFAERFGDSLERVAAASLRSSIEDGLLSWEKGRLRLTARGHLLHSEVCARLLAQLRGEAPGD